MEITQQFQCIASFMYTLHTLPTFFNFAAQRTATGCTEGDTLYSTLPLSKGMKGIQGMKRAHF